MQTQTAMAQPQRPGSNQGRTHSSGRLRSDTGWVGCLLRAGFLHARMAKWSPLGHGPEFDARRGREGRAQLFGQAGGCAARGPLGEYRRAACYFLIHTFFQEAWYS